MPISNLNIPAIDRAAQQNAMARFDMERAAQFNRQAPQAMAGSEDDMRALMSKFPQKAVPLMETYWKMNDRDKVDAQARVEAYAKNSWMVLNASPEERPQAVQWYNSVTPYDPNDPDDTAPEQRDEFYFKRTLAEGQTIQDMMAKGKPLSPIAKLESDYRSGQMDTQTYEAAKKKLTTSQPLVKIVSPGQTIDEKLLDMDLETITGTRDAVKAGEDFMPRLEVIVQGLESGNVETGRWQEATLPIRQWAQSAGWHDDPTLGQQEAVLGAISYMIPRMRVVGSGQTSDVEIKLFAQATAQFSNTPEGNILIARTMMQIQRRNKELLAGQRAWVRKHKTLEGFDADKEIGTMFPRPQTQQEYDAIRKGTVYIDTDGQFTVKL